MRYLEINRPLGVVPPNLQLSPAIAAQLPGAAPAGLSTFAIVALAAAAIGGVIWFIRRRKAGDAVRQ